MNIQIDGVRKSCNRKQNPVIITIVLINNNKSAMIDSISFLETCLG